jgi:hypothetical protein
MKFQVSRSPLQSLKARLSDIAARFASNNARRTFESNSLQLACIPTEFIGRSIIAEGLFAKLELKLLREILESSGSGGIMLDIGANIGNHAIYLSDLFERVICFEPFPANAALLRANILLSNRQNIRVEEIGLGDKECSLPYQSHQHHNSGAGPLLDRPDGRGYHAAIGAW